MQDAQFLYWLLYLLEFLNLFQEIRSQLFPLSVKQKKQVIKKKDIIIAEQNKKRKQMSTRSKEFKKSKYDDYGNVIPEVKVPKMYKKNYRFHRNK